LLALLDALIFPDKGVVKALGRELKENSFSEGDFSRFFRRKVGFLFQNPDVQLFCPTVREDIVFGPLNLGVPKEEAERRLIQVAKNLGIEHILDRPPHQLSVGEKKKAALASVLAIEPDVLLLDEPTAGLDPATTRHIIDIMLEANSKGKTIITATHDLHIVEEISEKVLVFGKDNRIARQASPNEVLSDLEFLRSMNLVHIHSHRHDGKLHVHPHSHIHGGHEGHQDL